MLLGRIELPTSSLPMTRSTTELQQRLSFRVRKALVPATRGRGALMSVTAKIVKRLLRILFQKAIPRAFQGPAKDARTMTQPQQSREERLAAKLRENLRRRKAQARAFEAEGDGTALPLESGHENESENESGGLSKPASES